MSSTTTTPTTNNNNNNTYRALVLPSPGQPFNLETRSFPPPPPPPSSSPPPPHGSVTLQILSTPILSYQREIYSGARHYPYPTPLVGGISAVARVLAVPPDATVIVEPGQLVYADCTVRARDDPEGREGSVFLMGIHDGMTGGTKKLMREVWRDGSMAERVERWPLENCVVLDEERLCGNGGGLGYAVRDLAYFATLLVPFGGLRSIDLKPGETVVVCPSTANYGGAGVMVAAAMGARVIAMGRNEEELGRLKGWVEKGLGVGADVETVRITGDEDADAAELGKMGVIDAVLDLTPYQASKSTCLKSAIRALRAGGRVSLMGFNENIGPAQKIIAGNITMKGRLMYEREDMMLFFKMVHMGKFPKGGYLVDTKEYGLEGWKEAFDKAAEFTGVGRQVVLSP